MIGARRHRGSAMVQVHLCHSPNPSPILPPFVSCSLRGAAPAGSRGEGGPIQAGDGCVQCTQGARGGGASAEAERGPKEKYAPLSAVPFSRRSIPAQSSFAGPCRGFTFFRGSLTCGRRLLLYHTLPTFHGQDWLHCCVHSLLLNSTCPPLSYQDPLKLWEALPPPGFLLSFFSPMG